MLQHSDVLVEGTT